MRVSQTEIVEIILAALKGMANGPGKELRSAPPSEMRLYGHGSDVDSLGLVQLLIEVEERVSARYGVAITLTDEQAMSQERSPFRTVESLAEYVAAVIAQQLA